VTELMEAERHAPAREHHQEGARHRDDVRVEGVGVTERDEHPGADRDGEDGEEHRRGTNR
jgi:hypothetical protein